MCNLPMNPECIHCDERNLASCQTCWMRPVRIEQAEQKPVPNSEQLMGELKGLFKSKGVEKEE